MRCWEKGEEASYRALCSPGIKAEIPAYGMKVEGIDAWWKVRVGIKPIEKGPIAVHVADTHIVDGFVVRGITRTYDRESGAVGQVAEIEYTFDGSGLITQYRQNIVWRS